MGYRSNPSEMARERPCVILHLRIVHVRAHVLASPNLCWIFCRVGSTHIRYFDGVLIIRSVCLLGFFCAPVYPLVTQTLVILDREEVS